MDASESSNLAIDDEGTFHVCFVRDGELVHTECFWVNESPTADAGPNRTVDEGVQVTLDGSNSYDPDDGLSVCRWKQVSGPMVRLFEADQLKAAFTAPEVGKQGETLAFSLAVEDAGGLTDTDNCRFGVKQVNRPPMADAGPNQRAKGGEWVTLDGSNSYDPDDDIDTYQWTQVSGTSVDLKNANTEIASFVAPDAGTWGRTLKFELKVTDEEGLEDRDSVEVKVKDSTQNGEHHDDSSFKCVVESSASGLEWLEQIRRLRQFRDNLLMRHAIGRRFTALYYDISPAMIEFSEGNEILLRCIKVLVLGTLLVVKYFELFVSIMFTTALVLLGAYLRARPARE
jgi:hypothetical protein